MHSTQLRKAKILCTIGPASSSPDVVSRLIDAGMNAARLNFSHGERETHRTALETIRRAADERGLFLPVIQDLQGPKIRTGRLASSPMTLVDGARVTITARDIPGTAEMISTTYSHLPDDVKPGDRILLSDGLIELRVVSTGGTEVVCDIVNGGELGEHKGINLPGVAVSAPSLTEKDMADAAFGVEMGVDAIALSFVRRAEDIADLQAFLDTLGASLPIIAKIEKPEAVADIERILEKADAVMVARGDLGVEVPTEDVPMIQKMIIQHANRVGKPVIIATQMLESMVYEPRPTRAEASDVANAVLDGGDMLMLSAETSLGKFPVEAVETMSKVIAKAEALGIVHTDIAELPELASNDMTEAVAHAACVLAGQIGAAAIVAVTHTGTTARLLSRYRPKAPIVAATTDAHTARWAQFCWGVTGMVVNTFGDTDSTLKDVEAVLVRSGIVAPGDTVVFTAGIPVPCKGSTNMVRVTQVG